jgi:hypothetical protein
MLVWDTGASIGLTLFCSDFLDYLPLDGVTVKDIARTNSVLGIGTIHVESFLQQSWRRIMGEKVQTLLQNRRVKDAYKCKKSTG